MSLVSVKSALKTRLDAISGALPTVWGNEPYTRTAGQAYQRVFLIPADPKNDEISASYGEQGVMQVDCVYPPIGGEDAALAKAVALQAWFPRKLSLPAVSGVITSIWWTPRIGAGFHDPDEQWVRPVLIRYFAPVTVA